MERVKEGEIYWYILFDRLFDEDGVCVIQTCEDWENGIAEMRYKRHNYFHTKEEAELTANKLRAVLNGADVIQIPTTKEIIEKSWALANENYIIEHQQAAALNGVHMFDWLKSKIVK